MSRQRSLQLRVVHLVAGIAVAIPAVGLYGVAGAWADGSSTAVSATSAKQAKADADAAKKAADEVKKADKAQADADKKAADARAKAEKATADADKKAAKDAAKNGPASSAPVVTVTDPAATTDNSSAAGDLAAATVTTDNSAVGKKADDAAKQAAKDAEKAAKDAAKKAEKAAKDAAKASKDAAKKAADAAKKAAKGKGKNANASGCTEDSFFGSQNPPSGASVKAGDTVSVVYSDESPLSMGGTLGRNGVTATAPTLRIDGVVVPGIATSPASGREKYSVKLSFTIPKSYADGKSHTVSITAYDSDQNKQGGDCGVATWTLMITDCHTTGGDCGGTTTGGTTGTTTGGTTGTTTGGTTGTTTGGTTGTTTGGTTGITTGGTGGAQTSGGTPCPNPHSFVGPMPAGCPDGGPALPFTGLDANLLIAIALIAGGLGLVLTAAGNMRRQLVL